MCKLLRGALRVDAGTGFVFLHMLARILTQPHEERTMFKLFLIGIFAVNDLVVNHSLGYNAEKKAFKTSGILHSINNIPSGSNVLGACCAKKIPSNESRVCTQQAKN